MSNIRWLILKCRQCLSYQQQKNNELTKKKSQHFLTTSTMNDFIAGGDGTIKREVSPNSTFGRPERSASADSARASSTSSPPPVQQANHLAMAGSSILPTSTASPGKDR